MSALAYKSDDAAIVASFQRWQQERAAYGETLRALAAEFGSEPKVFSDGRFAGLAPVDPIPKGWRLSRSLDVLVPDRRYAVGRNVEQRIRAIRRGSWPGRDDGMPGMAIVQGHKFLHPGAFLHDGFMWVSWSIDAPEITEKVDTGRWNRVPLSEFYAAVEVAERAGVPA